MPDIQCYGCGAWVYVPEELFPDNSPNMIEPYYCDVCEKMYEEYEEYDEEVYEDED